MRTSGRHPSLESSGCHKHAVGASYNGGYWWTIFDHLRAPVLHEYLCVLNGEGKDSLVREFSIRRVSLAN